MQQCKASAQLAVGEPVLRLASPDIESMAAMTYTAMHTHEVG